MIRRNLAAALALTTILSGCGEHSPTSLRRDVANPFDGVSVRELRPNLALVPVGEGAIQQILPDNLVIDGAVSFEPLGAVETTHDGIVDLEGASFAERFAGQQVVVAGPFDELAGIPTDPLTLVAGAPDQNLHSVFYQPAGTVVLDGLGPPSPTENRGEGAVAVLFDEDQSELGFSVSGANGGNMRVAFYRRDGSLIQAVMAPVRADLVTEAFAFRRVGGTRDIAGITIENDDPAGIPYFDFRISSPSSTTQRVPANQAAEVTISENGKNVAGVDIPAGTFAEDVIVTVRFVEVAAAAQCHDYLIGQIGRCLEITAEQADGGGPAILQQDVVVALCLPEHLHLEIFKFQERDGPVIALQQTAADFLNCDGFTIASAPMRGLRGLAARAVNRVGRWISPAPLYAANRGFGGIIDHTVSGTLSFYSWAAPMAIERSGLKINVLNRGKDLFSVRGNFPMTEKGFDPFTSEAGFNPAVHSVEIGFAGRQHTIPAASWRYSSFLKKWYYAAWVPDVGISAMEIDPATGNFAVVGTVPTTAGDSKPAFRSFTVRLGHRIRGAGLVCGIEAFYLCALEH